MTEAFALVATGRNVETETAGRADDEWRKKITSQLLKAPAYVCFDNIVGAISSPSLAAAITSRRWKDRRLGVNETLTLPNEATWLATGNNIHSSKEIARRTVRINLDALMEHPQKRNGFRHPNLVGWVRENRGHLVWACLTLCRAWIVAGRPAGKYTKGSFEEWAAVIGGILDVAGVSGLLGNEDDTLTSQNTTDQEWRFFVAEWAERYGERPVRVAELYDDLIVIEKMELSIFEDYKNPQRTLGHALGNRLRQIYGQWRIERGPVDTHSKVNTYQLRRVEP